MYVLYCLTDLLNNIKINCIQYTCTFLIRKDVVKSEQEY